MSLQLDLYNWQSGQILCLVSKPDSVVLEIEVDRNAIGQDILDKVCEAIGTVEKDYFGLQYQYSSSKRNEFYWLNLRNRVACQLTGQPPYRLRLRVKYFVKPHLLLQATTRELFYKQIRQDIYDGKINAVNEQLALLVSLIAQTDLGDYSEEDVQHFISFYSSLKFGDTRLSQQDILSVIKEHKNLMGYSHSKSLTSFLNMVANLPSYGTELYNAKLEIRDMSDNQQGVNSNFNAVSSVDVLIRLGPNGLEIVEKTGEIKRIPFVTVQLATHTGKLIDIDILQDDATITTTSFRMHSEKSSNAIYRAITEMLAFFTWETVHSSVIHQYNRDFKGHLLAFFRPDDTMGKQYVFDVQRTWREAHDNVRRTLYKRTQCVDMPARETTLETKSHPCATGHDADQNDEVQYLKNRLNAIKDALTCRVCMDKEINTVFWPCGHQICCFDCGDKCQMCPMCRQNIEKSQIVFSPIPREFVEEISIVEEIST